MAAGVTVVQLYKYKTTLLWKANILNIHIVRLSETKNICKKKDEKQELLICSFESVYEVIWPIELAFRGSLALFKAVCSPLWIEEVYSFIGLPHLLELPFMSVRLTLLIIILAPVGLHPFGACVVWTIATRDCLQSSVHYKANWIC